MQQGRRHAMIAALAFYLFAAILIASAVMVVSARNPVHSVLFLILAFFNAAGLFVLAGRGVPGDDPGHRLCRRRRGAVPVRRHDAGHRLRRSCAKASSATCRSAPWSAASCSLEMVLVLGSWTFAGPRRTALRPRPMPARRDQHRGDRPRALYRLRLPFQAAGLVLLVAMIGAIVLTLRHAPGVRRQIIANQVARTPRRRGMRVVKVPDAARGSTQ